MKRSFLIVLLFTIAKFTRSQEVLRVQNGGILTVQSGATLTLTGGITLDNGSQLINNGTITLKQNGGASGAADWTDNTTTPYTYGTGITVFNSTSTQTLNSPNNFGQLTINNAGLDLSVDITAQSWNLISGIVNTNGHLAIATSPDVAALTPGANNPSFSNSWINGSIRRYITPASVDSYDFPIGNATQSNQVTLTNLNASPLTGTQYLDVSFGPKPGTDAGLLVSEDGTAYSAVNTAGVWYISPDAEPTGGTYDLLLYLGGFTGLTDNEFAILERPVASSNAADWTVPAGSRYPDEGMPGRTVASGYARRDSLSAFSQFGIGMTITPLPVTLIGFDARRVSSALVALAWATSMEENNKGFGIERRLDREPSFTSIGFVPSAASGGNSAVTLNYSFTDTNTYTGISYYRLAEISLDGHSTYTLIRAVSGSNSGLVVSLYPNPGHGQFTLRVDGTDKPYSALITDERGQLIRRIDATGNNNVDVTGLQPGLYVIYLPDIFGQGQSFTEKVLIVP